MNQDVFALEVTLGAFMPKKRLHGVPRFDGTGSA
jgi:hypothetical protein